MTILAAMLQAVAPGPCSPIDVSARILTKPYRKAELARRVRFLISRGFAPDLAQKLAKAGRK